MSNEEPSAVRKGLMWWFDWPGNPYVSVSVVVDFVPARQFMAALAADAGPDAPPVSVHHLVVGSVARVLHEFPVANARIIGRRIEPQAHVGVGMPVNLLGHSAGARRETGAAVVDRVDTRSLREIAAATRAAVHSERTDKNSNAMIRLLTRAADRAPYGAIARSLDLMHRATRSPPIARALYRQLPFTTVVTNAGAPVALGEGMLFRAAAMEIPQRLFHVGTVWGISAVQNEVMPIGGVPVVRPALPIAMVFDHRLFDGVTAGRMLVRLAEVLRDPAAVFGAQGERVIAGA